MIDGTRVAAHFWIFDQDASFLRKNLSWNNKIHWIDVPQIASEFELCRKTVNLSSWTQLGAKKIRTRSRPPWPVVVTHHHHARKKKVPTIIIPSPLLSFFDRIIKVCFYDSHLNTLDGWSNPTGSIQYPATEYLAHDTKKKNHREEICQQQQQPCTTTSDGIHRERHPSSRFE